jgi:putative membrane protein
MDRLIKNLFLYLSVLVLIWSGISPFDRFTWYLEVFPSVLALPILFYVDKKWNLNKYIYIIFCLHSIILSVGGHFTYANVPAGFWVQEFFSLERNHYDRLGHFFQGISPTLVGFLYLKHKQVISTDFWLKIFCITIAVTFSVAYEFLEWWTALAAGDGATEFLGTQGDVWDTQWDMFMALCGSVLTVTTLTFFGLQGNKRRLH